ncbi:MAG: nucleotidyltransferase family protein [Chitinophagaceae bacterium]|nr:nucleotidyltransferase family protein [Chitinophagaceae bacterium]
MIAMILAAGLGTRLKPWTDHHPKALAVVNGKPVLQRNIEYLQQAGIYKVVVNVHHFADQIIAAVQQHSGWGSAVHISNESDAVLETGGGLQKAVSLFGEARTVLLMNADILTDLPLNALLAQHAQTGADATLAVTDRESSRCFLFDDDGRLCGWRNKKTGETRQPRSTSALIEEKAFSGIHVIQESIFRHLPFSGKFSMVDVYLAVCNQYKITAFDHSQSKFIDIGTMEKLEAAADLFA